MAAWEEAHYMGFKPVFLPKPPNYESSYFSLIGCSRPQKTKCPSSLNTPTQTKLLCNSLSQNKQVNKKGLAFEERNAWLRNKTPSKNTKKKRKDWGWVKIERQQKRISQRMNIVRAGATLWVNDAFFSYTTKPGRPMTTRSPWRKIPWGMFKMYYLAIAYFPNYTKRKKIVLWSIELQVPTSIYSVFAQQIIIQLFPIHIRWPNLI